jgi:hypothetical protein
MHDAGEGRGILLFPVLLQGLLQDFPRRPVKVKLINGLSTYQHHLVDFFKALSMDDLNVHLVGFIGEKRSKIFFTGTFEQTFV